MNVGEAKRVRHHALNRVADTWEALGRSDPFYAILTVEGRSDNRWDRDAFFATGRDEIRRAGERLAAVGLTLRGRALDFGCGVGRLTQALASYCEEVHGVDVAASMIAGARRLDASGGRCTYHLNRAHDLRRFADVSFDVVYSSITLQHMPPPLIRGYIAEFLRVLKPDGVLVFQLPSHRAAAGGRLRRFVRALVPEGVRRTYRRLRYGEAIEMHGIDVDEMKRVIATRGGEVIDVSEDDAAPGWVSFTYCVRHSATGASRTPG